MSSKKVTNFAQVKLNLCIANPNMNKVCHKLILSKQLTLMHRATFNQSDLSDN